jgi:PIN domain nuclease of toxin-antitoxin system
MLALIQGEPGAALVDAVMHRAVMSSVNLAEVYTKLIERGPAAFAAGAVYLSTFTGVEPFTEAHAKLAGELREKTRSSGLSLGDRACLALALTFDADAYTTDTEWAKVNVGCRVKLIRNA